MEEEKQINVEVSRATTAEEEAQGKGLVDGIMEVQKVTESSGPLQPKSLNGLPSASAGSFRQRQGFKEKSKLEQVVIEVSLDSSTDGYLASKQTAEIAGVVSVELGGPDRNLLEVIGEGVDAVNLVTLLRKKFGNAKLISTGPVKEPMKDIMEDEPELQPPVSSSSPHRLHPISESKLEQVEIKVNLDSSKAGYLDSKHAAGIGVMAQSAGDTAETRELNGVMEMETQTTTHSNPSRENAESSRKTKTAEWTVTITNLLLEAISASFEQLDYPLPSMVMAFVALLLSILDLIHKAREKRISCDGSSLLPCVEYFGFAGAVWQCSHTTVGYHYSRQNLDNPIKMCLLPFIFALCVLISKAVKSN